MGMPKLKAYRKLLERDAMEAFAVSDENKNGTLGRDEIRNALMIIAGAEVDEEWMEQIIDAADTQHTGEITYDDCMKALFGTKPIVPYVPYWKKSICEKFCDWLMMPKVESTPHSDKKHNNQT